MTKNHLELNTISQSKIEGAIRQIIKDHFKHCPKIIFEINATNGYLSILGYIEEITSDTSDYEFIIQLPKLYKQSLNDEQGAILFDKKIASALYMLADEFLWPEQTAKSLFLKLETDEELEEIIV